VAAEGVRFENCYVSDAPCLPSRAALFTGRFGIHTGIVNHGGTAADMRLIGPERGFNSPPQLDSWPAALRRAGFQTVSISPFAERHSAWWFYHGWREMYNTGKGGAERADEVAPSALKWLADNARADNWFLHVNFWDPHTRYRTPAEFGDPFCGQPLDGWLTDEMIRRHFESYGPHSAQDLGGFGPAEPATPRAPSQIRSLDDYVRWINGYDTGILYADRHFGMLLDELGRQGVLDQTAIIISADHGENQGELNIYGDHHTACHVTSRAPLVIRWPGLPPGRVDRALHYQADMAATVIELAGGRVPGLWDGRSFADTLREGAESGRDCLVTGNCAWSCQRGVRWGEHMLLRTYHDGLKDLPPLMLFKVGRDPHMTCDLSAQRPDLVREGQGRLEEWTAAMLASSPHQTDPMWNVIREGGPYHVRGCLRSYCEHLRRTGRAHHADALMARHGRWMT
jgi:arylsulfatase A-like enzyme